jgi:hypothetical protein
MRSLTLRGCCSRARRATFQASDHRVALSPRPSRFLLTAARAFTECLVQSHAGFIELLPAVPPELATGSVAGIVARPGVEVSIRWEPDAAGEIILTEATLSALRVSGRTQHRVVWRGREVSADLERFAKVTLHGSDFHSPAAA